MFRELLGRAVAAREEKLSELVGFCPEVLMFIVANHTFLNLVYELYSS